MCKLYQICIFKKRVAPLSEQAIPRLELLSAVVLSRLIHSVKEALSSEMKIDKLFCWTDSKIAWYWIVQSQKEWKPFVQHRVDEIRKLVPEECWNHCPGADNPADLLSIEVWTVVSWRTVCCGGMFQVAD